MHELRKYQDDNGKWWVTNDSLLHYAAINEENADFLLNNFFGQSKCAKNYTQQRLCEISKWVHDCVSFGGTAVACLNTNRNFIGIEKDAHYFDIAKKRIEGTKC